MIYMAGWTYKHHDWCARHTTTYTRRYHFFPTPSEQGIFIRQYVYMNDIWLVQGIRSHSDKSKHARISYCLLYAYMAEWCLLRSYVPRSTTILLNASYKIMTNFADYFSSQTHHAMPAGSYVRIAPYQPCHAPTLTYTATVSLHDTKCGGGGCDACVAVRPAEWAS